MNGLVFVAEDFRRRKVTTLAWDICQASKRLVAGMAARLKKEKGEQNDKR